MSELELDGDLDLLERLVGDVEVFSQHWGCSPMRRSSGEDFSALLDVDRVEEMLSGSRPPTFRVVRDGSPIDPRRTTRTVRLGGQAVPDVADVARIADEVADGATLVLQGLQRTDVGIAQLCRSLERAISHPVQANAYLSPPCAAGLAAHADDHDVLVLQVVGSKHWDVQHLGAVHTKPGDVLYLPAGIRHAASTQEATSLHLTIGIVRVTHGDALRRVLSTLAPDDLARPLPLGYARPERLGFLTASLDATITAATIALKASDAAVAAKVEQRRARTRRSALPVGQLRSVLSLTTLSSCSRVRRRPDAVVTIEPFSREVAPMHCTLTLPDRRIHLPEAMRTAAAIMLSGRSVEIAELPNLTDQGRLVLVRRCIREGLVVVDQV